jgi:hypothetical protein
MENKNIKLKLDSSHEKQYKNIDYIDCTIFKNNDSDNKKIDQILNNYDCILYYFDGHLDCKDNETILTNLKINNEDYIILGQNIINKPYLSGIQLYKKSIDHSYPLTYDLIENWINSNSW